LFGHLGIGLKFIAHQILAQNEHVDKTKFASPKFHYNHSIQQLSDFAIVLASTWHCSDYSSTRISVDVGDPLYPPLPPPFFSCSFIPTVRVGAMRATP
jgi:hypothetical protein